MQRPRNKVHIVIRASTLKAGAALCAFLLVLASTGWIPGLPEEAAPKKARATYQFLPTGGAIVTGTAPAVLGATAAAAEGTNLGSYRAAQSDDAFHWGITSTASGYNAYLDMDGFQLNGANKIIIQTEIDMDITVPSSLVQICDWVSTTGVNNAADAQCTGGGWRNLNLNDTVVSPTSSTSYDWEIYDGYWNTSATAKISTPLTNFVNGSNKVRIRYFSTTNTTSTVHIDFLRAFAVVNPVYTASGATQITGGTIVGDYSMATIGGTGQTGSDDTRFRVPGTAGAISDFYLSYTGVKTYTGANTILVRAEYSCSTTGINLKPKIWNFNSSAWEDLTTATIACLGTDAINAWAKNNVTIANYVSGGEVRIGWYGSGNSTVELRIDMQYIMIGSTNTSGTSDISFGTNSAGSVTNTRDLDMNATANTWNIATVDESNTQGFSFFGFDNDGDAVATEESVAANTDFPVTLPNDTAATGIFFAGRFMSGNAGQTVQLGIDDYSAATSVTGGWSAVGAAVPSASLTYTDNITVASVLSGGSAGFYTNPEDHIDTVNNLVNLRLRTTTAGAAANNTVAQWDFAMVSIQWTEDTNHPAETYQFHPTGGAIVTGTAPAVLGATAAAAEGTNLGDYRATESDDGFHWGITSTTGGYNAYLDVGGVQLNGANKLIIQSELDLDATIPQTLVQICDWTSSTGVNAAADAQCTGGGWRNLNPNDAVINTATNTAYDWEIYDGYWNTSATAKISTPLTNFVDGSNKIRIRYVSTTNTTSVVHIDFLRVFAVVNPVYSASGATQITGGTITGDYSTTAANGAGQTGSDNARISVPGTVGVISDFYLSYTGVETYTGANAILVRAEYSCSATTGGQTLRPKIWNFNTSAWENLASANIACSITDATSAWAKGNITMSHYVSNGEIRVGWFGSVNNTVATQIDMQYVMIGSVNSSGTSDISFGTNSANSVTNTRDLDMTGTTNTWNIASVDESNTQGFSFYGFDTDGDATATEESTAANVSFPVTVPTGAAATGIFFAGRFMSGAAGTVQLGIDDYSAATSVTGGWSAVGAGATTVLTYTDNIATATVASGGAAGWYTNPEDHIDTVNNEVNLRLRTTAAGAAATNAVAQWDFAMVSVQWVEIPAAPSLTFSTTHNDFPALSAGTAKFATTTLSVNTTNASGWNVTLSGDDQGTSNTVLDLTTDANIGINDQAEWIPAAATTSTGNAVRISSLDSSGDVLAFRVMTASGTPAFRASSWWGSLDSYADNASTLWAGIASSTAANRKIGNTSVTSGGGSVLSTVLYYLDVPVSQQTGAYSGGLTYIATANP